MVKAEQSVVINRPVEDVFAFAARDYATNTQKWQPSLQELRQTSAGPIGVGSTLHQVRDINGKPTPSTMEITQYEPNRILAWRLQGEAEGSGSLAFEPADGNTRVSLMIDTQVSGLGRLAGPMISRAMNKETEDNLGRLKSLLET